jgi:hypothetical protein
MWLIDTSTFLLREFTRSIPPYATLSPVREDDEMPFESRENTARGFCNENDSIIHRACGQARTAGVAWLWNYAMCVDKRSSAAQSEAINSLAQIYRDCQYSIVYLADLVIEPVIYGRIGNRLPECRWFKDIWALPQIIFSRATCFFSSDWTQIGTKRSLIPLISSVFGIDEPVLENSEYLEDYSIARRMSWASQMTASRPEDFAYALLGLFNISMPVIYGEGQKAFFRLQERILSDTVDFSLLAWDDNPGPQEYIGAFAPRPAAFHRFRTGPARPLRLSGDAYRHCAGITMETSLWKSEHGLLFLPLLSDDGTTCYIPLARWDGFHVRKASRVEWNLSGPVCADRARICLKRHVSAHMSRKISTHEGIISKESVHNLPLLGNISTSRESRCSNVDYISKAETCSIAPPGDLDSPLASQYYLSSVSSGVIPHKHPVAWTTRDRSSYEGTFGANNSHAKPELVHEFTSGSHHIPEDNCHMCHSGKKGVPERSCRGGGPVRDAGNGPQQSTVVPNRSPSADVQVLDVNSITKELAEIAADRFLSRLPSQRNKRSLVSLTTKSRKRPKHSDTCEQFQDVYTSEADDGETVLINKASFFACPFYVRNNQYGECVRRHYLSSIKDVKEHVCWDHRRPKFCPVCKQEFATGKDRDAHIRLRTCRANASGTPDGITDDQEERLERAEETYKPYISEELRWFDVWDIIFPRTARPGSAFYTGEREVAVCAFRKSWRADGEQLVAEFLETKSCRSYSIPNEERTLRKIHELVEENVVGRIFDGFGDETDE